MRLPQGGAGDGGGDAVGVVGAFEGVGHGHGEDAALLRRACLFDEAAEGGGGQAAAGGVVDEDVVVCRRDALRDQFVKAVAHGFGAGLPADAEDTEFGGVVVGGRLKNGVVGGEDNGGVVDLRVV